MFANAAVLIFLTKFLLNRLGYDSFGLFRYVVSIQASMMILDLGLGVSLNRFVSRLLALGQMDKINAAVSFSSLLFLGLGLLAFVVMISIGYFLPSLVTNCSKGLYRQGFILMAFIGLTTSLRFWGYAAKGVLFGVQKHFIVNGVLVGSAMLRAISIVFFFLRSNYSTLPTIGLCFMGSAAVETLMMWIFAKGELKEMTIGWRLIEKGIVKEILGFSAWVTLLGLTTVLLIQSPTFLAGRFYGAKGVAFISLPLLVLSQIERLSGGFALALVPVAGTHGAMNHCKLLHKTLVKGTKFCAMLCFPIGVLMVILGEPLFEWFQEGFGWTWTLLAVMAGPFVIRATQRMSSAVLMGAGSVKGLSLGQIVVVFAIGVLSWLFAVRLDMKLYGLALGAAIPIFVYDTIYKPWYVCDQIGFKWWRYMVESYTKVTVALIPMAILAIFTVHYFRSSHLLVIFFQGTLCFLFFAVCSWVFVLNNEERKSILGLVKSQIKKTPEA